MDSSPGPLKIQHVEGLMLVKSVETQIEGLKDWVDLARSEDKTPNLLWNTIKGQCLRRMYLYFGGFAYVDSFPSSNTPYKHAYVEHGGTGERIA
ncbi:hypothetical protein TNCV_4625501 [Trichonephila clavipes]|nr:hypothetical protein TNCV_4625501 [Trichonephila clavipes]